ncbi:hypothetical protein BpHYR1_005295 [Brachionus plicatilis]|uniref:Uncharacterized protein n=1 Tax=Brachionus plicatilis TaxID=10195 RepID=A0A3M7S5W1_BRAPC|nr:hypothetical protein BpHYR1_005295 [Brachionus plicatilis]
MSVTRSKSMYLFATSAICLASLAFWYWRKRSIDDLKKFFKKPDKIRPGQTLALQKPKASQHKLTLRVKRSHYDEWWSNLSQRRSGPIERLSCESRKSEDNETCLLLNKLKILTDSANNSDVLLLVDKILKSFRNLSSNQKVEFTSYLGPVSKAYRIKMTGLVELLNSEYSAKNSDLFSNYRYNNTVGEMATEIVLNILKALANLSLNEQTVRESVESELFCDMMHELFLCYIFDLEKNKNNVKRLKKIEAIKFYSIKIFAEIFEHFKKSDFEEIRQSVYFKNSVKLASNLLNGKTLVVDCEPDEARTSRFETYLVDKSTFFKTYICLIENLLVIWKENEPSLATVELNKDNFAYFLIKEDFFIEKMNVARKNLLFKEKIDSIFDVLIKLKDNVGLDENVAEKLSLSDLDTNKTIIKEKILFN